MSTALAGVRPRRARPRPARPGVGRAGRDRPGLLWAMPAVVLFATFGIVPVGAVVVLSLTRWNGLGTPQWTGLHNWRTLWSDDGVWSGIRLTLTLTVVCWALQTPLALLLGVWSAGRQRFRAVLAAAFFVPLLLSTAAIALTWLSLLDPNFGLPQTLQTRFGVDANVLGSPRLALYAAAFVISWQFVPLHMLIYQAAARQIPHTLYEAAQLDGADRIRQFTTITLPQLRSTVIASSVLIIVGSLTYFEAILLLTNGGPGTATRVLPLYMYVQGFVGFDMGYASALAVVLVAVGTVLSIVIVRATGYQRMASDREGM